MKRPAPARSWDNSDNRERSAQFEDVRISGLIEMRYVSGLEKVTVGDYVMTTGQDGIYPPGLNVGRSC